MELRRPVANPDPAGRDLRSAPTFPFSRQTLFFIYRIPLPSHRPFGRKSGLAETVQPYRLRAGVSIT